jgi:GTP-binding protein Era
MKAIENTENTENSGMNIIDIDNINDKKTVFTAIVGRPNVGKSTLLNTLLNEKISIISKKPQTTRNKITGILTQNRLFESNNTGIRLRVPARVQYVFFDTPGIHLPKSLLGNYMTKSAKNAIGDVDVIILIIEPIAKISPAELEVIQKAKSDKTPVILVINKIDTISKDKILEVIRVYSEEYEFAAILPVSALSGDGVELVLDEIDKYLSDVTADEFFFPEDMITDQPERQIASEIIREKALRLLTDEVPHGIGVSIEEFNEDKREGEKNLISIRAEIFCERETHKRIIIGKKGEMIKKIGTYAREDLEKFFGARIYLDLWVKVKKSWRDKQSILSNLGYNEREL